MNFRNRNNKKRGENAHCFPIAFQLCFETPTLLKYTCRLYHANCVFQTLEQESTFDGAIMRLGGTPTAAPAYFIVGGTTIDQGAVITKDRIRVDDFWQLNILSGQ